MNDFVLPELKQIIGAMLFVRNPTGVSHSPAEHAEIPDCLVGVSALADTLGRLTR